jgi:hypothetical protein
MPAQYDNLRGYLLGKYPECKITVMYEAGFGFKPKGYWQYRNMDHSN